MLDKIKNMPLGHLTFPALSAVLGLSALSFSGSIAALTVIIGLLIAIFGGTIITLSLLKSQRDRKFVLKIVFASILTVLGLVAIFMNDKIFSVTVLILCAVSATDAALSLNVSLSCRKNEISGWWIVAISAASVIASSFALVRYMPDSTRAASVWLGITLLALAALNVLSAIWSAKCKTAEKAELYYEVYRDIKDSGENLK